MIRVNLLPSSKGGGGGDGRQFLLLVLVALIAQGGLLFYLQSEADNQLVAVQNKNAQVQNKIKKLQTKTKTVAALEKEKESLQRQKQVLNSLVEGQSGPARVLYALGTLLRKVEDPEEKLKVQNLGWNPDWDPKNLWIDVLQEKQRNVTIMGVARSNEDLSQFLHRLNSSKHFHQVELIISEATTIKDVKQHSFVKFTIKALALYGPADVRKLAEGKLGIKKKRRR